MKDKFLEELIKPERWAEAVNKAAAKGIKRYTLQALVTPEKREQIFLGILDGTYRQLPPHNGYIPKDDGTMRKVRIFEDVDRILDSVITNILFEKCPSMVSKKCYSYQKGIGCGDAIKEIADCIGNKKMTGVKIDLSKYFDSVPREYIMKAFDDAEKIMGESCVFPFLKSIYNDDNYLEYNKDKKEWEILQEYQSLKQGCAIGAWLADVVLCHIDEKISKLDVLYARYSDDIICIGKDAEKGVKMLEEELARMQLKLNPKKVMKIDSTVWFNFLGYEIKGNKISLSKNRIRTFQKEIESRTKTIHGKRNYLLSLKKVHSYLYGSSRTEYAWGTTVLPIINCPEDIEVLNNFVMDCLRSSINGRNKTGGIGGDVQCPNHFIVRGTGANVKSNRERHEELKGYKSLGMMRNALLMDKGLFVTLRDN